jgi:prephenate dehydratase
MFYVDLEADVESEAFKPILEMFKAKTDYLKILGSY